MGMEIPATMERGSGERAEEEIRETARSVDLLSEREQNGAVKEEEEVEGEEEMEYETEEEDGEIVEAAEEESEQNGARQQPQQQQRAFHEARELRALKARPSALVVGPPAVGKRSLVSRLVARGRSSKVITETGVTGHGWTIDTKYYTANVSVWMARLGHPIVEETTSINSEFGRCEALIMVFDMSSPNSFEQLQEWSTGLDLDNFEIRLCVGNKADRVPDHFAHTEYRRKLQKKGESSSDPHPEFWDFGINRTEGSSLLDDGVESAEDRRRSCVDWCSEHGFEYIEACAIDEIFDECMTVDGDQQGVPRIHGALSAHMWPGLVMKDGSERTDADSNLEQGMTSDDDSDYYMEYELLSNGSAEPWEGSGWEEQWSFSSQIEEGAPESSDGQASSSATDRQPIVQAGDHELDAVTAPFSDPIVTSVANAPAPQTHASSVEQPASGHEHVKQPANGHEDHPVPVNVESRSAEKEGAGVDKPEPSLDKPESSLDEPEPSVDNPEPSVDKSEPSVDNLKPSVDKLDPSVDLPKPSVDKPKSSVEKSNLSGDKPKLSVEKINLRFDKPKPKGQRNEEWEDMEKLMSEMASMRTSMRSMSDQHRRETAARLALRMAAMFKDDDEGSDLE